MELIEQTRTITLTTTFIVSKSKRKGLKGGGFALIKAIMKQV